MLDMLEKKREKCNSIQKVQSLYQKWTDNGKMVIYVLIETMTFFLLLQLCIL